MRHGFVPHRRARRLPQGHWLHKPLVPRGVSLASARRSPAAVIVPGSCDVMPYGIMMYCVLRRKVMLRPPDAVMRCLTRRGKHH